MDLEVAMAGPVLRRGVSMSEVPAVAARELYDEIYDPDASLIVVFCAPTYDLDDLGRELYRHFGDTPMIGATTAGEITPTGYLDGSLTGVSISGSGLHAEIVRIDQLSEFEFSDGDAAAQEVLGRLETATSVGTGSDMFGFLLVDGLSMQEELLVSAIYRNLGETQLIGGSAGDGTSFEHTAIYHDGAFRSDCAVFTLVRSAYPFVVFKTEHFVATDKKMVVTEAIPDKRIVTEINGEPAGREYARAVGLEVDNLTPLIFSTYPVVVNIGGETYVRSIQKVNDDESLTFFCAIDVGIVLTVGKGVDIVSNLQEAFDDVQAELGQPALVLGCDCILRNLETKQRDLVPDISRIMQENNVIGFATYGEQFNGMHVNQTFTGVAIGASTEASVG